MRKKRRKEEKEREYKNRCQQCLYYFRGNIYNHPSKTMGGCDDLEKPVSASKKACSNFVNRVEIKKRLENKSKLLI